MLETATYPPNINQVEWKETWSSGIIMGSEVRKTWVQSPVAIFINEMTLDYFPNIPETYIK